MGWKPCSRAQRGVNHIFKPAGQGPPCRPAVRRIGACAPVTESPATALDRHVPSAPFGQDAPKDAPDHACDSRAPRPAPCDRRLLTLAPYGTRRPTTGGTKRIHYLNRGFARAGWQVLQIGSASINGGIRDSVREAPAPLMGPRDVEIAPGYREEAYFNPLVILGNRLLRQLGTAQVASTLLPRALRPSPRIRRDLARHEVVLFEHPQMFDMAVPFLRPDHLVILDAHNIESRLYPAQREASGLAGAAARALLAVERRAMRRADLVFTCSDEDRAIAIDEFAVDPARVHVAPNGADLASIAPADADARARAKAQLGLVGTTALFVGSRWGPNVEAAQRIAALAEQAPDLTWLVVGAAGEGLPARPGNLVVTGRVDDLAPWYAAADIAVNPVETGSGSNIKIFEYLAAGLPTVSTPFGARGVGDPGALALDLCDADAFADRVRALAACPHLPARRRAARALAERSYDWNAIAARMTAIIEASYIARRR